MEFNQQTSGGKRTKSSPRIDMTAMVDVAFLLLTFFILTTTLAPDFALKFITPSDDPQDPTQEVSESKMLTLVLDKGNRIKYYFGSQKGEMHETGFSDEGVRKLILSHLKKSHLPPCKDGVSKDCWDPIIAIKPTFGARYQNLVDILDELTITGAQKYAWSPLSLGDSLALSLK